MYLHMGGQRSSVMAATHFSAPCFVLVFSLFLHYKTKQTVVSCPEIIAIANGLKFSYIR